MASAAAPPPWIAPPVRIAWDRAAANRVAASVPASASASALRRVTASASTSTLRRRPPWVLLAILAVYFLWGSTYLAIRIALETIPPFQLGAVRFLVAGGALYAALRLAGVAAPTAAQWRTAMLTGALLFVGGNGFVVLGEQWVSSGLVALIVGTMPLFAALFGGIAGQPPSRREFVGLMLGFLGVGALQLGGALEGAGIGALVVLLSPVCWALGVVVGRVRPLPPGPMAAAAQMLCGGAALLALALVAGEPLIMPSTRSALALAHLIVFGSLIGFTAYGYLLRHARPAVANSYAYVNPLVAIVLGAAFAGEPVTSSTWFAAAVILSGVAVLRLPGRRG
jgi:drug/metabolite transporter (DMT)-like permease